MPSHDSQRTNGTASGQPPPVPSNIQPEQQTRQSEGSSTSQPQQILQEGTGQIPNSVEAVHVNGADVANKETLMGEIMRATTGRLRWRLARDTDVNTSST
jgi:hypothetical protein